MIPGFIDAHLHVMGLGLGQLTLDLSQTRSLDEALSRLAAYAAANEDRPWLLGRGWNQERWGLGRFPTAGHLLSWAGLCRAATRARASAAPPACARAPHG